MTRTPRGLSARQFVRALETDGFALQRVRGSHRIYRHTDGRRVVMAYHGLSDTLSYRHAPRHDRGRWLAG